MTKPLTRAEVEKWSALGPMNLTRRKECPMCHNSWDTTEDLRSRLATSEAELSKSRQQVADLKRDLADIVERLTAERDQARVQRDEANGDAEKAVAEGMRSLQGHFDWLTEQRRLADAKHGALVDELAATKAELSKAREMAQNAVGQVAEVRAAALEEAARWHDAELTSAEKHRAFAAKARSDQGSSANYRHWDDVASFHSIAARAIRALAAAPAGEAP